VVTPNSIFSLVYISAASSPFTESQLFELLQKARAKNSALGVTGMLLCKDGKFLQVLEGEKPKVRQLFETIMRDPRHEGILTLQEGVSDHREFPDWSMGFRDLRSPEIGRTPGFSHFLKSSLTAADFAGDPSRAKKLLLLFKDKTKSAASGSR